MLLQLQNKILEMIAKGAPLKATIDRLCTEVELVAPETLCSVLTVDLEGRLHPLSAPHLPVTYSNSFDNIVIGESVGSCGTAAYRGAPVMVSDIASDPLWSDFKHLALDLGLAACWSTPIFDGNSRVIATFAFYYREKRGPTEDEQTLVATCSHLCSIALERFDRAAESERLAFQDALTRLSNRAKFDLVLEHDAEPVGRLHGLLLVDIDNLKLINDTYGHRAGDALIQAVAMRLAGAAAPNEVFRLSGDEFAILVHAEHELDCVAKAIIGAFGTPAICDGHSIQPKVTIGGAFFQSDKPIEIVRREADFALYHAKENGRDQYVLYTPELKTEISHRFEAIQSVAQALDEDRIEAHYQPIVRLDTGDIVGLEALCRMRTQSGEIIAASDFHHATTDAELASRITHIMITSVAKDLRYWIDQKISVQHVGINVSSADFHSRTLGNRLRSAFAQYGVPLKHIILEVTESVYLGEQDQVIADEIKSLRASGLLVALDDFGTGYASLTHLLTMPVDILKVDKSFVSNIVNGGSGSAIVKGLLGIAKDLGIRVVAEGVETIEQVDYLKGLGCVLAQGYFYSRAVDRHEITKQLIKSGQRAMSLQAIIL